MRRLWSAGRVIPVYSESVRYLLVRRRYSDSPAKSSGTPWATTLKSRSRSKRLGSGWLWGRIWLMNHVAMGPSPSPLQKLPISGCPFGKASKLNIIPNFLTGLNKKIPSAQNSRRRGSSKAQIHWIFLFPDITSFKCFLFPRCLDDRRTVSLSQLFQPRNL